MPSMSPAYCKKTPVKKMGFSQKASCRAQGLIKRTDGTKRKSPKYVVQKRKTSTKRSKRKTSTKKRK